MLDTRFSSFYYKNSQNTVEFNEIPHLRGGASFAIFFPNIFF
jgi:hypothetical protein